MIRDVGVADSAQEDGFKRSQCIEEVLWRHLAMSEIMFGAPREVGPFEGGEAIQNLLARRDNFLAHAIARDDCDFEFLHGCFYYRG